MLRLAPRFFRYWEPDWPQRAEALLSRAEKLMQTSTGRDGIPALACTTGQTADVQPNRFKRQSVVKTEGAKR
jgi:hypothetical protein